MWKRSAHPNIVPLLGIISTPLRLISEWIPCGDLTEHLKQNPNTDRLGLVGVLDVVVGFTFTPATSYLASLRAFITSTPVT